MNFTNTNQKSMLTIRATGTTRAHPPIQQTEMDTENIRTVKQTAVTALYGKSVQQAKV